MKVLVYRKCSTCMKALKWLDEHNISYEERAWSYVKKKYKLNTTNFLFLCNC